MESVNIKVDFLFNEIKKKKEINEQILNYLLCNYKGTLSKKDQKIFLCLKYFEEANYNLTNEEGFIEFGKIKKNQLVSDEKDSNFFTTNLDDTRNLDENQVNELEGENKNFNKLTAKRPLFKFLNQFKKSLFKSTIFLFPKDIKLDKIHDFHDECLDIRFMLLSFYHLLNSEKVTYEEFIDTNCLAVTFVSLSFEDEEIRKIGYSVLKKFKDICRDNYGSIWRIILDKLSVTIESENEYLKPIITSFFIHLIPFIKTPTYSIYENLIKFLTKQPEFKDNSIVGFIFSMLLTDDLELEAFYQNIALLILINGIKTEEDFNLCLHNKIINFLLTSYNSPILYKQNLKLKVLSLFLLICKLPKASNLLCTEKAFLLWLNQIIVEENDIKVLDLTNQILNSLINYNYDFYPLFENELKLIKNICIKKIDILFEQNE